MLKNKKGKFDASIKWVGRSVPALLIIAGLFIFIIAKDKPVGIGFMIGGAVLYLLIFLLSALFRALK